VAVDSKHKLIVEQEVTNAGTDLGLLAPTASAAKELLEVKHPDREAVASDVHGCCRFAPFMFSVRYT